MLQRYPGCRFASSGLLATALHPGYALIHSLENWHDSSQIVVDSANASIVNAYGALAPLASRANHIDSQRPGITPGRLLRCVTDPMSGARAVAKRRRRELVEADQFHATVVSLLCVSHADWNQWEQEWLEDEAQRPTDYIYTDNEWKVLNKLVAYSKTFTHYAGYSIQGLLKIACPYRVDMSEHDEKFLEQLHAWGATDLKLRQVRHLASICREFEGLDFDEAA
jgi:hypothetical protein